MRPKLSDGVVALVVAPNAFRDEEYATPRSRLLAAGFRVTTAGRHLGPARGEGGTVATCDALLSDLEPASIAAVVFVGGEGAVDYWDDPRAHGLAARTLAAGGVAGAICLGVGTLARAGLLRGKRAAGHPRAAGALAAGGAVATGEPVEIDGRIVTGRDPAAASEFADTLVRVLRFATAPRGALS